ncbi:hypothetical protein NKF26_16185 [Haladaptatus sp. AB618]|uniref:hypothetical protein n=1 Tax=Haladaptatus sp. AB618 TaxID=2934173 RepID=UPI00209C13A2|nr:hypothetical protein [Haladaptatus sp. AB618]MCO8255346.1 hypothetical protein [Haladaptatus sp. AB618]
MGYRWKLCTQWSRRDRLTIVIIAVATAFLVGTTLLLVAANTQTSAISSGFNDSMDVTHYDSVAAADAAATNDDDIVLPVAAVKRNGTTEYVVGVPPDAPTVLKKVSVSWREARFPQPPSNATFAGPVGDRTQQRFVGTNHTETVSVAPTSTEKSVFPRSWYIGKPATVRSLGTTDAYVVHTSSASNGGGPAPFGNENHHARTLSVLHRRNAGRGFPVGVGRPRRRRPRPRGRLQRHPDERP